MPYSRSKERMRGSATFGPNSPRDMGVGDVMPRAIHPDIASKSKVRHAMCFASFATGSPW
ncbi:hypothetical protein D3C83_64920 [compost metagenome]